MPRLVLIVDDNALNRALLSNTLSRDYTIIEAENGKEALALMAKNYKILSAVLLDIMMPVMNGYEVLRNARENPLLTQIPIIMVTGSEDEDSRVKALSLGANDFILKPFNADIVKHCLKNNIALRETASILNAIQKDKLTGLYNREAFFDKVSAIVKNSAPGAYLLSCFDIDSFKLINDQFGAVEGDRILHEIGRTVKADMEQIGGIGGRISSDNFAVLMPVEHRGLSITRIIDENRMAFSDKQAIVFSVGRYVINDTSLPASAIYDRAFIAKRSIKGRYDKHIAYFNDEMLKKLVSDQQIIADMDKAVAEHQFEIWFQPQYNHSTCALVGAEALVRWRHPVKGLIPPAMFIPVFEQNGFIFELDKYVWEEACRYLRAELDAGRRPLPVSVNISRCDMFRQEFLPYITGLVQKYDIPIMLLRLEVTESAFAESTKHIINVVKELISLGFTLEIDDFGSGYSSLNTLKNVPAQVLKLDMRFFEDEQDSERSGNIIESVVRMTKWLGMSVIAEGVESIEQADYLRSIGCDYIQGYLYAKPMPENDYRVLCGQSGKEEKLFTLKTVANLDNSAFWNPKSMDTLIFNSFVGSACIFEYRNGRIDMLRVTKKYAQVFGSAQMSVSHALRLDWFKFLDEPSKARVRAAIDESITEKKEVNGEYIFVGLPGCQEKTYINATLRVIASAGDRHLVYCLNENITAQRQAELREKMVVQQLHLILQNVNGGICAAHHLPDGGAKILYANDNFYALYGCTKEQFEAETADVRDYILLEDRPKTEFAVQNLIKNGGTATYEYRRRKRDGSIINVLCTNSVVHFDNMDEPVLLSITNDITELTNARIAAQQSTQKLTNILNAVNGGICTVAFDDNGSSRVVFANEYFYGIFGFTKQQRNEIPDLMSLIHPDDRASTHELVKKLYATGAPCRYQNRCLKRDGSIVYVHCGISLAKVEGYENKVMVISVFDITKYCGALPAQSAKN